MLLEDSTYIAKHPAGGHALISRHGASGWYTIKTVSATGTYGWVSDIGHTHQAVTTWLAEHGYQPMRLR